MVFCRGKVSNQARSSGVRCWRVQINEFMALRVKSDKLISVAEYSSWLPFTKGQSKAFTLSKHSDGFAP